MGPRLDIRVFVHLFPLHSLHYITITGLFLHYGDLTDSSNLCHIISKTKPDEVYNLGAQSHVKVRTDV